MDVPRLQQLLDECSERQSETVFRAPSDTEISNHDPFTALSAELRATLLERLEIGDVANLRLASRSVRQLPQSYFHHLILREMPWIWELRSSELQRPDWYALWNALSATDGGSRKDEAERTWLKEVRRAALARIQNDLKQRGLAWGDKEYFETMKTRAPDYDEKAGREIREAYASGKWPGRKPTEINGLRNRRRVWECVEEILRRIEVKNRKGLREHLGSLHEEGLLPGSPAGGLASNKARYGWSPRAR